MPKKITVVANWDREARVWVATSDDVPGLITEADTVENLRKKLIVMIPELLELNNDMDDGIREIPFHLVAESEEVISVSH